MPPDSSWLRVRSWNGWVRWVVLVWCVLLLALCVRSALQPRKRNLYPTWATAGNSWLQGANLYPYKVADGNDVFRYGPTMAVAFVPLHLVPERAGNVLWRLLNAAVLLGGLAWWLQAAAPAVLPGRDRALIFLLIIPLALTSLNNGQPNPLLTGLLLAGLAALASDNVNLGALCIAAGCVLKLYPTALALLLVAAYPRRFAWRWLAALGVLAALPFCLQHSDYVLQQYGLWWTERLRTVDGARRYWPDHAAYRDLWLLLRVWRMEPSLATYQVLQATSGVACALLCLLARLQGWPRREVLLAAWTLGSGWMMLCGPATESSTYVVLAPSLAWVLLRAWQERWLWPMRGLVTAGSMLLLGCVLAGLSPRASAIHGLGLHPLGTLLFVLGYVAALVQKMLTPVPVGLTVTTESQMNLHQGNSPTDQAA